MQLTIHTIDSAPPDSRPLLDGIADDLGLIPNMAATIAGSPALLAGFDGLRRALGSGRLDPIHRETAGVAVGVAVNNRYGVAFHSTVLARLGVADSDIERMRAGQSPAGAATAAVFRLARAVVVDRGRVDDATLDDAIAAGLTTEEILEVVGECVFATLVGLVDNLAGGVELDEFLAARAWLTEATVRTPR